MRQTTTGAPAHRRVPVVRRETRPIRGKLTLAAALFSAFAVYTWLAIEWGPFVRLDAYLNRNFRVHSFWPVLHVVDRIGQRAICLPILGAVMVSTAWRHRSWRPFLVGCTGVFVINLIVLIVKLALSRGKPLSGESFFSDGDLYPSGHTANILVVYGLCYHLITYYGRVSAHVKRVLIGAVCTLSLVMVCTSLLLRWHWFSDLIGGFMVGGAVLALAVGIDSALPFRSARLVVTRPEITATVPVDEPAGGVPTPTPSPIRLSGRFAGHPSRLASGPPAAEQLPRERAHILVGEGQGNGMDHAIGHRKSRVVQHAGESDMPPDARR